MVVDRTLQQEQDGDDPETVRQFVATRLKDCVNKGSTYFFVAFSSHGGGFVGFGKDENTRRRRLVQSNDKIAGALRSALNDVSGAPDKFDSIAFDACLMQAVGAADDNRDVANYLLASEAIEPGHGWEYSLLSKADTAMDLARDIHANFLTSKHGFSTHLKPKTLAIVDMAKYTIFLGLWDFLCAELQKLGERGFRNLHTNKSC